MKHISSEELVKRYQNGEEQALKLLIRRFHPKLIRAIRYQVNGPAPIKDIAQECWYVIIPKLADVKLKISFEIWAMAIVQRKAIDWIREQQRLRKHTRKLEAELKPQNESSADQEDQIDQMNFLIQELPPTQRMVLELFYLQNLTLQEISNVLDVAKGTVKSRLFYAREELKRLVNQ